MIWCGIMTGCRRFTPARAGPAARALAVLAAAIMSTLSAPAGGTAAVGTKEGMVRSPDGVPIHYIVAGRGDPALIFVHGWSGDLHFWDGQIGRFAARHRVAAIDLAGHGASGGQRAAWTMEAFARDVESVARKLRLRKLVLVGHSMGAVVGLEAARLMPDRVAALVPVDMLHDVEHRAPAEQIDQLFADLEKDYPAAATAFVRRLFPRTADPELVARVASQVAARTPATAVAVIREVFAYDQAAGLSKVRAPIRAINGDWIPTSLDNNRRHHPRFDALVMKGVGHFPMLEAPEEFNRLLADAVSDLAEPDQTAGR